MRVCCCATTVAVDVTAAATTRGDRGGRGGRGGGDGRGRRCRYHDRSSRRATRARTRKAQCGGCLMLMLQMMMGIESWTSGVVAAYFDFDLIRATVELLAAHFRAQSGLPS